MYETIPGTQDHQGTPIQGTTTTTGLEVPILITGLEVQVHTKTTYVRRGVTAVLQEVAAATAGQLTDLLQVHHETAAQVLTEAAVVAAAAALHQVQAASVAVLQVDHQAVHPADALPVAAFLVDHQGAGADNTLNRQYVY